jgi:glycosyltransferase involved in cell wall biosynthesis
MKLFYTSTSYPPAIGGGQLHLHYLVRELAASHQVQVATHWCRQRHDWLLGTTLLSPRQADRYEIDAVPVHTLTWSGAERAALVPALLAFYACQHWAVRQIAEPLARQLATLAGGATDLIHNVRIGREGLSWASYLLARQRDVPFVFTPLHHPRWESWLHRSYLRLYRTADLVVALTEVERQTLVRLGVDERRIVVTGVGPVLADEPPDPAAFRQQHGLGDSPFVLFLGQQYAYKGIASLLAAAPLVWQRFPEVCFVFAGPRTSYSTKLFAAQTDPRIVELGPISPAEKNAALAGCALFCLPSNQESFGGVFLEAWSFGKPVVGGDIPAIREVISVGEDGLVARQDAPEVADRLLSLLADPALAERLGAAGRHKVETRYSWSHLADLTLAAYQQVLHG